MSDNSLSPLINRIYEGEDYELQAKLDLIKDRMAQQQESYKRTLDLQQIQYNIMPGNPRLNIDPTPGIASIEGKYTKLMEEAAKEHGYVESDTAEDSVYYEEPEQEEKVTFDDNNELKEVEEPDSLSASQETMIDLNKKYKEDNAQEKPTETTSREAFMNNLQSIRDRNASMVHKPKF